MYVQKVKLIVISNVLFIIVIFNALFTVYDIITDREMNVHS